MKRFDLDQFVMLTMVLATAGAVGMGVYSTRGDADAAAASAAVEADAESEQRFPEADPEPVMATAKNVGEPKQVTAAPDTRVSAGVMPPLDAPPEVLDEAPGPQVETMTW